jgi:hypothetical protein
LFTGFLVRVPGLFGRLIDRFSVGLSSDSTAA